MDEADLQRLTGIDGSEESVQGTLRQVMVTGAAITLPLVVTLMVLGFVLNFVSNALDPVVGVLNGMGIATGVGEYPTEAGALFALVVVIFVVGLLGQRREVDRVGNTLQAAIEGIPGIGSVYNSFNRMSEVLLDSDSQSFQEVKLVEFPHNGSYVLAFLTAEAPDAVESAAGHDEMLTLFVPLAPNPVMGGHLVNMPADRVADVDLTVEEGIRAIMTSGVAVGDHSPASLDAEELEDLTVDPDEPSHVPAGDGDRTAAYSRSVGAAHARTPAEVAERRGEDENGHGGAADASRTAHGSVPADPDDGGQEPPSPDPDDGGQESANGGDDSARGKPTDDESTPE